jgi:general secretion pathway protein D
MKSSAKALLFSVTLAAALTAAPLHNEKIALSIDGMGIGDLIKLVAATTHQNIFIGEDIPGTISYAGNKAIHKKDLFGILQASLDSRGYTLVDTGGGYLSVVKTLDATQMNLPFMEKSDIPQMQTHIFTFRFASSESMGAKIKHFTSKNGKITASKESNSVIVTDFPANITTIWFNHL